MENFTTNRNSPDLDLAESKPCAFACGLCASCVFAKTPQISTNPLWTVADSFHRGLLVDLLSRCRSPQVLENMQRALDLTSWSMFSYPESRELTSSDSSISIKSPEKPRGFNGNDVRDWFDRSPDLIKSHYLCHFLLRCDNNLLRALANLINVLLVRFEGCNTNDDEEPAMMVLLGSSKSYSGISKYKDFILNLPVNLAKKILGFLDEPCLKICCAVSLRWQFLAKETLCDIEFRKSFKSKMLEVVKSKDSNFVNPTYANVVTVQVPVCGNASGGKEDNLQFKLVSMEERNVYCGGYFTTAVMEKRDPRRLIDARGKSMLAASSKGGVVHLFYLSVQPREVFVLKGNMDQIHALLLCEDKNLVVTGGYDAVIKCWNVRNRACVMTLSGHTRAVNCLDVCGDRLVSGSKDYTVKIWCLQKGKLCEEFIFKHRGSVLCVKMHQNRVYSCCEKGQVKIWDLEKATVHKVIDGHQSSVRCLFFDEWYLLTGDVSGAVMAWSTHCDAKDCLKTFTHPKEVKSLALTYLRVVTGCADGKVRVFNFLTGDCLKVIVTGSVSNHILSVHFHENSFIVNSVEDVKRFHFGEIFWDYANATNKEKKRAEEGSMLDKPKPPASAPAKRATSAQTRPRRKSLPNLISAAAEYPTREQKESAKVATSEKAASARIKRRGPHHPPTRDFLLLNINAAQNAKCAHQSLGANVERNARLRDDWSSPTPTGDSAKETHASVSRTKREVSTAPGRVTGPRPPPGKRAPSPSAKTQRVFGQSAASSASAKAVPDLEAFARSTESLKSALNSQTEFKLLTTTQLNEQTKKGLVKKM